MNNQLNNSTSTSTSTGSGGVPGSGAIGAYTSANTHYCGGSQPFILMDQGSLNSGMVSAGTGGLSGGASSTTAAAAGLGNGLPATAQYAGGPGAPGAVGAAGGLPNQLALESDSLSSSQYLLSSCMKPNLSETEQLQREILKADRSLFVQELLLQVGLLEKK